MSLIRCSECKKKISNIVNVCPHCGCSMNKDYIKELNEIDEQIKEQQKTINGIKVQVKGQVEQLGKEKKHNLFKCFFCKYKNKNSKNLIIFFKVASCDFFVV